MLLFVAENLRIFLAYIAFWKLLDQFFSIREKNSRKFERKKITHF